MNNLISDRCWTSDEFIVAMKRGNSRGAKELCCSYDFTLKEGVPLEQRKLFHYGKIGGDIHAG